MNGDFIINLRRIDFSHYFNVLVLIAGLPLFCWKKSERGPCVRVHRRGAEE